MNQLSKTTETYPLLPSMKFAEQDTKVIVAQNTDFCRNMLEGPAIQMVLEEYNRKALTTAGMKQNQELSPQQRIEVIKAMEYVVSQRKWLRMGELRIILSKGLTGELGEAYSYNALTLNKWIEAYDEQIRKPALVEYNRQQQEIKDKEEAKAKKELDLQLQPLVFSQNRQAFFDRMAEQMKIHELKIEQGILQWDELPENIDPGSLIYNDLLKAIGPKLGFDRQTQWKVWTLEMERAERKFAQRQRAVIKAGGYLDVGREAHRKEAERTSRSRLLRMLLVEKLNTKQDIEAFFHKAWKVQ